MRVSVLTNDKYLFRIVQIMLSGKSIITMGTDPDADVIIYDCDSSFDIPDGNVKTYKVSRTSRADAIKLPFDHSFFDSLLSAPEVRPTISLSRDGKHALVRGETVKLTAHEYALLDLLISGGENYTSRTEIASKVWGGASDSLVNVYIHYLREKLEEKGEKVIISSRNQGYRLCAKFQSYGRIGASITEEQITDTDEKITDTENEKTEENEKTRKGEENA